MINYYYFKIKIKMSISIINIETENGKEFVSKVRQLRNSLFPGEYGEKTRQIKELTPNQLIENCFLLDFMKGLSDEEKKTFDVFKIKKVTIGNYSRKGGCNYKPNKNSILRILLHFGHPEVYYLNSDKVKDDSIPVLNGEGIIIPSASKTYITVYPDPRRILYDPEKQAKISKLRPRKYNRITLIYDFEINNDEK